MTKYKIYKFILGHFFIHMSSITIEKLYNKISESNKPFLFKGGPLNFGDTFIKATASLETKEDYSILVITSLDTNKSMPYSELYSTITYDKSSDCYILKCYDRKHTIKIAEHY